MPWPPVTHGELEDEVGALRNGAVFNVKNYGAVGDGVADDGPAFNSAITAALAEIPRTNGGGAFTQGAQVYAPPGAYRIATPVVHNLAHASGNNTNEARRRLTLEGAGDGHTVLLLRAPASTYALDFRGGMLTLGKMRLTGDGTSTSYGINLGADNAEAAPFINQFVVRDVTIRDMGRWVNLTWAFDGQFVDAGFSNLAGTGVGFNVAPHSADNCNNITFNRCHWEPARFGGTLMKMAGNVATDARQHSVMSFVSCHWETRSFGTRAIDIEAANRLTFVSCQFTQNSDPGDTFTAAAAVPMVRLANVRQATFVSSSIMRGTGTGWTTKLLELGGRNTGLAFNSCFFYIGEGLANASKAAIWQADTVVTHVPGVSPFELVATAINDNNAAQVPNEITALGNPATTAEMWTSRFDATTKRQIWGYGAAGGDWTSGRTDRMALAKDGGLVVGGYLAHTNQASIATGASNTFTMNADNNPNRRGVFLVVADFNGAAYALVYSTGAALHTLAVGASAAVGATDPGTANALSVYLSGVNIAVTNRLGSTRNVTVIPLAAFF